MKYAFDHLQTINELLRAYKKIILLTDFDGTLTPIQEHPDMAILSEEMHQILLNISHSRTFFLGIITGRSLLQIKKTGNDTQNTLCCKSRNRTGRTGRTVQQCRG